jgi:DNA-binding transcriptional LysR family regulator
MHWTDRIGRRLKPRDLHIFLTVIEQGNMAKAAGTLAISRPVVSKTIADLERTLGVRLLDRSPQGLEPTLYGQALIARSQALFDELRQTVKEIETLSDPSAGELRIGCTEPMAAGVVAAVIDQLSRHYPRLRFQVELGDAATLQLPLRERRCELIVARTLGPAPEHDMQAELLFHEELFVAAGVRHKWSRRRKIELAELVNEPWILAPFETEPGSPVGEAFRACNLEVPDAIVVGYSLPLRNTLLSTGRFLTVVPGSVLRYGAERQLLSLLPVKLPRWRVPISIITLKSRTLSPTVQLFTACARQVAKPLANRK